MAIIAYGSNTVNTSSRTLVSNSETAWPRPGVIEEGRDLAFCRSPPASFPEKGSSEGQT